MYTSVLQLQIRLQCGIVCSTGEIKMFIYICIRNGMKKSSITGKDSPGGGGYSLIWAI